MTRSSFCLPLRLLVIPLAFAGIGVLGCGDDGDDSPPWPDAGPTDGGGGCNYYLDVSPVSPVMNDSSPEYHVHTCGHRSLRTTCRTIF